jgi:hypothetical protein
MPDLSGGDASFDSVTTVSGCFICTACATSTAGFFALASSSAFGQSTLSRMSQPGFSFFMRQEQRPTRNMQASSSEVSSSWSRFQAPSTRPRPNTGAAKALAGSILPSGPASMVVRTFSTGSSARRRSVVNFSINAGPGPSWLSGSFGSWMGSEATCSRNFSRFSMRAISGCDSGLPSSTITQTMLSPARMRSVICFLPRRVEHCIEGGFAPKLLSTGSSCPVLESSSSAVVTAASFAVLMSRLALPLAPQRAEEVGQLGVLSGAGGHDELEAIRLPAIQRIAEDGDRAGAGLRTQKRGGEKEQEAGAEHEAWRNDQEAGKVTEIQGIEACDAFGKLAPSLPWD